MPCYKARRRMQRQQRPAALCNWWRSTARTERGPGMCPPRRACAVRPRDIGAERVQRIIRDEPAPDKVPKRVDRLAWIPTAGGLMQRIEEARPRGFEDGQ